MIQINSKTLTVVTRFSILYTASCCYTYIYMILYIFYVYLFSAFVKHTLVRNTIIYYYYYYHLYTPVEGKGGTSCVQNTLHVILSRVHSYYIYIYRYIIYIIWSSLSHMRVGAFIIFLFAVVLFFILPYSKIRSNKIQYVAHTHTHTDPVYIV
jgi:hypothetical protein